MRADAKMPIITYAAIRSRVSSLGNIRRLSDRHRAVCPRLGQSGADPRLFSWQFHVSRAAARNYRRLRLLFRRDAI
jgi:hypothetical protein